jgi:Fur family ferric uptake transcriptional regulator
MMALRPEVPHSSVRTSRLASYRKRAHDILAEHLAAKGLRLTSQREKLLEFLLSRNSHGSIEEIYQAVRGAGLGRATVFRTMKVLEECDLVSHLSDANGALRYEVTLDRPHHDHLVCIACGRIVEVRWPEVEKVQRKSCVKLGFEPVWHRHEIFGRCADCGKRRTASSAT